MNKLKDWDCDVALLAYNHTTKKVFTAGTVAGTNFLAEKPEVEWGFHSSVMRQKESNHRPISLKDRVTNVLNDKWRSFSGRYTGFPYKDVQEGKYNLEGLPEDFILKKPGEMGRGKLETILAHKDSIVINPKQYTWGPNPPTATGMDRAAATGPNPPTATGMDRAAATGPNPPTATGMDRAAATGPNPPTATGMDRAAATGPNPPTATGMDRAAATGPNPPTATGMDRAAIAEHNPSDERTKQKLPVQCRGGYLYRKFKTGSGSEDQVLVAT
ncbi:hypothetical protein Bbelb_378000 [Branchiostoma belcheri]|nr:hypothetical protein Bbelb_378000 [Branchiostoma belcheri]